MLFLVILFTQTHEKSAFFLDKLLDLIRKKRNCKLKNNQIMNRLNCKSIQKFVAM